MADLSNNSFIPKQGAIKRKRVSSSRQVYVFTIISYVMMFATLLASGGVYFYSDYIKEKLNEEVLALNQAIADFDETEMFKVLEFDSRLTQANLRLNNSASILAVFDILEATTAETIGIISLDLIREEDEKYILSTSIGTDSFDSTIFQRGVYKDDMIVESVVFEDVINSSIDGDGSRVGGENSSFDLEPVVTFTAELEIPLSAVPYDVNREIVNEPLIISEPVEEFLEDNEENI